MSELKIIVPENFKEMGSKINAHIQALRNTQDNYLVDIDLVRFNNGEGKALINETIREKDVYIISDVTNYDITYEAFGKTHNMMPDEHYQDIKRILSAICGHAKKITLIMPYMYQSRQDKKSGRESLDCAVALQELVKCGVNEVITFDIHNSGICNAIPDIAFENIYATDEMLFNLITKENISSKNLVVVSPDEGAMKRASLLSDMLGGIPVASFYKQRDYTKLENGHHPIIEHRFLGPDSLEGKDVIVADDMIASGGSLLDTSERLKKLKANRIFLIATFALFTNGPDKFDLFYKKKYFDRVYATNLSYVPENIRKKEWFTLIDCSYKLSYVINELNQGHSISSILDGEANIIEKLKDVNI